MRHSLRRNLIGPASPVIAMLLFAGFLPNRALAQDEDRLIRVTDKSTGRKSTLYEKVVVVSEKAVLSETPKSDGEPLEPWSIFFRIKNDDGSQGPVNNRCRVGSEDGKPLGWIQTDHVKKWNTRFVLEPCVPDNDRTFEVHLKKGGKVKRTKETVIGKKQFALISDMPIKDQGDDTEYPVIIYMGRVQGVGQSGTIARERNEVREVKLEIMFVIESTDFMFTKYEDSGLPVFDYLKEVIRETVDVIRRDEGLKGAIRLGFAEYQDSVPKAKFTSRITCDLTDNHQQFLSKLDELAATKLEDDWPDDVLGGLNEAMQKASWSPNSIKHIILLGMASCQLSEKNKNPPQSGGAMNQLERGRTCGYNSSGMTISQLIGKALPRAGTDSKARTTKTLHALLLGRQPQQLNDDLAGIVQTVVNANDAEIETIAGRLIEKLGKKEGIELLQLIHVVGVQRHQRQMAVSQYQEIAKNNGEVQGIYDAVEPNVAGVKESARKLSSKLQESFKVLEKVRSGGQLPSDGGGANEISRGIYQLYGDANARATDDAEDGTATTRDQKGREVAFKRVMISENEIRRLHSTLNSMYTKFRRMTNKADRQNVGDVLNSLKESMAETGAGQDLTADVKLKDIISELPLRTAALDTTAKDLSAMTPEAFKDWLRRLEAAMFATDELLSSKTQDNWYTLNAKAVNAKFTFLKLSELP